ncbi:MAG: hypothetical protein WC329_01785 [Candidatus Omnitrophota bacterium]|jgi:hypothetical protein
MENEISASVSLSMKINLGNYESAEAFLSISGITKETSEEDIQWLLDGKVKITYDALKLKMVEKIKQLRGAG